MTIPKTDYAEVVEEYLAAAEIGSSPTLAVARRWSIPYSTAAKRVQRARRMGLLPATRRGQASLPSHRPATAEIRGAEGLRWNVCRSCLTAWPCSAANRAALPSAEQLLGSGR